MILRAAERLHALAVPRARLIDVARDRRRPDEAHGLNARMRQDGVDGALVAMNDGEDAGRKAGLRQELGAEHRGRRVLLRRLQDERVAARDRQRVHPHRHHRREVERRDAGDHAERLPDRVAVDVGRHVLRELALEKMRQPAGELDDFDPAIDLAKRVGEHLAVLARQDLGEVALAALDELAEGEEDARPCGQRRAAPGSSGVGGRGDRRVDDRRVSERDPRARLAARRVVDVAPPVGRSVPGFAINPVRDAWRVTSVSWSYDCSRSAELKFRAPLFMLPAAGRPGA